jgi:hypothetical protein
MTKLGNCKCIPKKDKEDLLLAIGAARDTLLTQKLFAGQIRKNLKDVDNLKTIISTTPTCQDGDILKECKCISNSLRDTIYMTIPLSFISTKKPDKETIGRLIVIEEKIKKIPRCKIFGLF